MPLVKCWECDKEVSTSAEVCPHCGAKSPAGKETKVVIYRKPTLFGGGLPLNISIDGINIGKIKHNEKIPVPLSLGDHIITAKLVFPGAGFGQKKFRIHPPKTYQIVISIEFGMPVYLVVFDVNEFESI